MALDAVTNSCYGLVATAPTPATSGTTLVVTLIGGSVLPTVPYNAYVNPYAVGTLPDNMEIFRVTAQSVVGVTATLTITRAQEGTSARAIVVGDQVQVGPTKKFRDDIVSELGNKSPTLNDTGPGETLIEDPATGKLKTISAGANVTLTPTGDDVEISVSAPGTGDVVGPAGATDGNFALFDGPTGKQIKDGGTPGSAAFADTGDFDPAGAAAAAQAAAIAASLQKSANLSDVANAATSFNNIKQQATTSATGVVELATDGEVAANLVPQANDLRLSNARTPTAHAASHITGGSDIIPSATTSAVGLAPAATAPASGLLNVLGIGNGETVRTDKALFDTTNPADLGVAAPGTAVIAARRDHVHKIPTPADLGLAIGVNVQAWRSILDKVYVHGADVASAGTIDLDAATGDLIDVTGTTAITAITLANGVARVVRFTGALTLTHGASLVLPGSANITTAAGDFAIFRGYAAGVVRCVVYSKLTGKATIPPAVGDVTGLGTGVATQLADPADGSDVDAIGFRGIPQNSQSSAYTLVMADAGKHIYHPSADTTARTWTIPANGSVAFPIGTVVTFVNDSSAGVITIAITTDTLVLAGAGTTGSRTLAANGIATAIKMTSTRWQINGTGLT